MKFNEGRRDENSKEVGKHSYIQIILSLDGLMKLIDQRQSIHFTYYVYNDFYHRSTYLKVAKTCVNIIDYNLLHSPDFANRDFQIPRTIVQLKQ